jgi:myo-inositol-1(or 4)-monophosphatase
MKGVLNRVVSDMKETIIGISKEAGKTLLQHFGGEKASKIHERKSRYDYSTEVDKMVEDKIIEKFQEKGIKGTVIAEEGGKFELTDDDYTIYVDPLDGTINYSMGIPIFCTSIGVKKGKEMEMGVIYYPIRDELYFAQKGKGAYLNGKKIHLTKEEKLGESIIEVGWSSGQRKQRDDLLKRLEDVLSLRMMWSAALGVAFVGCGRFDGLVHTSAHHPWDIAAGSIIIEEAGGKITDFEGKRWDEESKTLIVANRTLHKKILRLLEDWG